MENLSDKASAWPQGHTKRPLPEASDRLDLGPPGPSRCVGGGAEQHHLQPRAWSWGAVTPTFGFNVLGRWGDPCTTPGKPQRTSCVSPKVPTCSCVLQAVVGRESVLWVLPRVGHMGAHWEACCSWGMALLMGLRLGLATPPQGGQSPGRFHAIPHAQKVPEDLAALGPATLTSPKSCKSALMREGEGAWMRPPGAPVSA